MFLLHILFDGEVLLPTPSWVSYEPQSIIGRNKVHWVNTTRENNWFPTAEGLEKIVLKNKNNNYLLFLNFVSSFGITKCPSLQPPVPHHLLNPLLIIVCSGQKLEIDL